MSINQSSHTTCIERRLQRFSANNDFLPEKKSFHMFTLLSGVINIMGFFGGGSREDGRLRGSPWGHLKGAMPMLRAAPNCFNTKKDQLDGPKIPSW
ncbi:hypothetical protein RRG08_011301 [Elysia crispata]|uniref:Uncharacterized protein n=1 Tax=Elysia crispata TaxID=231223 RepID=A0AAE0YFH4_9GAST|nr:hypothetical protein RRG08_011301 [Elysia crispata]